MVLARILTPDDPFYQKKEVQSPHLEDRYRACLFQDFTMSHSTLILKRSKTENPSRSRPLKNLLKLPNIF